MTDSVLNMQSDFASSDLIHNIVEDLFSFDALRRERIFEYYFVKDAMLVTPLLCVQGVDKLKRIYGLWNKINGFEPTITNIVFDGRTAVVHFTQNVSPRGIPFTLKVPAITTLHFADQDNGLSKIYRQDDSWTLEGLLQSVPVVSFWYNRVLRVALGKLVSNTAAVLEFEWLPTRRHHAGRHLSSELMGTNKYLDPNSTKQMYQECILDDDDDNDGGHSSTSNPSRYGSITFDESWEKDQDNTTNDLVEGMVVLEE